jgi:glycosyltransferase involved in cell wall biosynthesis
MGNLCRGLLGNRFDVVHIHFSDRGSTLRKLLPCLIAYAARRPVILHSHCAFHREFYASIPSFLRITINAVFRRCTCFISLSKSWDDYFADCLRLPSGHRSVLYNPVKFPQDIPDRSDRPMVTFIFLGSIGSRHGVNSSSSRSVLKKMIKLPGQDKGCFDCLRAMASLPLPIRDKTRLIIAGDGDINGAKNLALELGIEQHVSIRQWLTPPERDEALGRSDAFILPSYHEGLPMSMLEAMAFGLSVIVTPVGGIPEIVSNGREGLLVRAGDIEKIAEAVALLVQDPEKRMLMGIRARNRVELLGIDRYMNSLLCIYQTVLRRKRDRFQEVDGVRTTPILQSASKFSYSTDYTRH